MCFNWVPSSTEHCFAIISINKITRLLLLLMLLYSKNFSQSQMTTMDERRQQRTNDKCLTRIREKRELFLFWAGAAAHTHTHKRLKTIIRRKTWLIKWARNTLLFICEYFRKALFLSHSLPQEDGKRATIMDVYEQSRAAPSSEAHHKAKQI